MYTQKIDSYLENRSLNLINSFYYDNNIEKLNFYERLDFKKIQKDVNDHFEYKLDHKLLSKKSIDYSNRFQEELYKSKLNDIINDARKVNNFCINVKNKQGQTIPKNSANNVYNLDDFFDLFQFK